MSAAEQAGEGAAAPDPVEAIRAAQSQVARTLQVGHLIDDPLLEVLKAQDVNLSAQLALYQATKGLPERGQVIDPAGLARIEQAAVRGAEKRTADLAWQRAKRFAAIAAAVLVATNAALYSLGHWRGSATALAGFHETEQGLIEAFRSGPAAAAEWLNLMHRNDLPSALATCKGNRAFVDQTSGERACSVPLRLGR